MLTLIYTVMWKLGKDKTLTQKSPFIIDGKVSAFVVLLCGTGLQAFYGHLVINQNVSGNAS